MSIKVKLLAVCAAGAALISKLTGGFSSDLKALLALMALDFITGLMVAGIFRRSEKSKHGALESKAGWKGICKKVATLVFVVAAHCVDVIMGTNFVRTGVIAAYSVNEAVSLVENAGVMGIPVPAPLKKAIDVLKEKEQ